MFKKEPKAIGEITKAQLKLPFEKLKKTKCNIFYLTTMPLSCLMNTQME